MRRVALVMGLAVGLALPAGAAAQGFGIGPRFSFVRGDVVTGDPSSRFIGGTIRMGGSKKVAFEVALDYRSFHNDDKTIRVRETPLQGSLLIFPVRSVFAPYLLGGVGLYRRKYDDVRLSTQPVTLSTEQKFGIHLGLGAEVSLGGHAAIFADYRFRFVKFGDPGIDDQPVNIPGSSFIPGLDKFTVSHQGSMWTSGVAFYF